MGDFSLTLWTVGHVEKTNDRDYEVEERCGALDDDAVLHTTELDADGSPSHSRRRYRTMESAALRLQKEAKGYLDSLRGRQSDWAFKEEGVVLGIDLANGNLLGAQQ